MLALPLSLALFAGAQSSPPRDLPLHGTLWTLSQISPRGGEVFTLGEVLPKPNLRLSILPKGHRLRGSTGCNEFRGDVQVQPEQWRTGHLTVTRLACTDRALSLESDYLELLTGATRYQLSGHRLTVFAKGSARLIFTGTPPLH